MADNPIHPDTTPTADNDVTHIKVGPYQDPAYRPQVSNFIYPGVLPIPVAVGQNDSLCDPTRRAVGQDESMTSDCYEQGDQAIIQVDTNLDESLAGEDVEPL